MNEIEYKTLLTKSEYENLSGCLRLQYPSEVIYQTNFYYDTPEFDLFSNNETLRLRIIEDKKTMEYKHNKRIVGLAHICEEESLSVNVILDSLGEREKNFFKLPSPIYKRLGELKTTRTNFHRHGILLSLDLNEYLGVTDYEIEIEVEVGVPRSDCFQMIPGFDFHRFEVLSRGKFSRFMARYLGNNCM